MRTLSKSALVVALVVALATPAVAQDASSSAAMMRALGGGGLTGKRLARAIEAAQAHPLGSERNPIRADGPRGQREYLSRLRCADASTPTFSRDGSVGDSPYGYIMDAYSVVCAGGAPATVLMDMYHSKVVELRPVTGFTIIQP